jgi:uncharacterized protein
MTKLLFFVAICIVVYLLVKSGGRKRSRRRDQAASSPESMVACARCGLYLPVGESLERDGRRYCCPEHLRLDAGDHS